MNIQEAVKRERPLKRKNWSDYYISFHTLQGTRDLTHEDMVANDWIIKPPGIDLIISGTHSSKFSEPVDFSFAPSAKKVTMSDIVNVEGEDYLVELNGTISFNKVQEENEHIYYTSGN